MDQPEIWPLLPDLESVDRFEKIEPTDLNECEQDSVVALALEVLGWRHKPASFINAQTVKDYLRLKIFDYPAEVFGVLFLDIKNRLLADEELFQGTLNGSSVYPRIVVQKALAVNAGFLILYHNHPSGDPKPSNNDALITTRLIEALALVDIEVLDHIIVGVEGAVSMAEKGMISPPQRVLVASL